MVQQARWIERNLWDELNSAFNPVIASTTTSRRCCSCCSSHGSRRFLAVMKHQVHLCYKVGHSGVSMNRRSPNRFSPIRPFLLSTAVLLISSFASAQPATVPTPSALQQLSSEFWEWRASEQPFSFDDIPRLDRPSRWAADWSSSTIAKRREELSGFET